MACSKFTFTLIVRKTAKVKTRKDSDTAIAVLGVRSGQSDKNEIPRNISLDTILSEKDEVKMPLRKVSGTYKVEGQSFNITIMDKPFLVSCGRIEDELSKQIR